MSRPVFQTRRELKWHRSLELCISNNFAKLSHPRNERTNERTKQLSRGRARVTWSTERSRDLAIGKGSIVCRFQNRPCDRAIVRASRSLAISVDRATFRGETLQRAVATRRQLRLASHVLSPISRLLTPEDRAFNECINACFQVERSNANVRDSDSLARERERES